MSEIDRVVLVGFMGAGKTTVGRELARILNWQFCDLDARIEAASGRSVPAIFAEDGEPAYRRMEARHLRQLLETLEDEPAVIALGGGAFVQDDIRQILRDHDANVVHLEVEFDEALRRCAQPAGVRPLFKDPEQARLLHEQRLPYYRTARWNVPARGFSPREIAEQIVQKLQLQPAPDEEAL
jgi:shikimate kinase